MTRVMILMDAYRVSGLAKGILDFCEATQGRVEPQLVVFQRGDREPTELREECARRGVRAEVLWERFWLDPSVLIQARRVVWSFRPDVVETNGYKADMIGLVLQRWLDLPWVAVSHGVTSEGSKMRFYWLADRAFIRRADRTVAVSEARRRVLVAEGCSASRVVTIRNAVAMPAAKPADARDTRLDLGLDLGRPVVAAVGRLSPEKGQRYFLEAMAQVVTAVPGATGLIVGEGQEEGQLRALAAALGLHETIHFTGYRRDIDHVYSAIDLLVLPSLSEGLPMVALEAMAHGIAVVGTRVGGVPEVIADGLSGLLVPSADAGALARAIVTLLLDPTLRRAMGEAGRERVECGFSIATRAERVLAVYEEARRAARARVN